MREALLNEALIKEIALQVVQQGLLSNWLFYAVLLALSLVSGVIGAYLSKYFGKRGETAATKADFDEILKQLQATTKISEEVRSAVSHADWVAREWKTIRRIKLEELVNSAMSVSDWADSLLLIYNNVIYESGFSEERKLENRRIRFSSSPAEKSVTIAVLYFSDTKTQLIEKCNFLSIESIKMNALLAKASKDSLKNKQYIHPKEFGWDEQINILLNAIVEVRNESAKIMKDIEREDGRKEKLGCS